MTSDIGILLIFCNFIISNFIFLVYFLIFAIFGYLIFRFIESKLILNIEKKNILIRVLISYGIGVSIIISISFLILSFIPYLFDTFLILIITIDMLFITLKLVFLYRKDQLKKRLNLIIQNLNKNSKHLFILVLLAICFYFFNFSLLWVKMSENISLYSEDPYFVLYEVYYFLDNHQFYPNINISYPRGIVLYIACHFTIFKFPVIIYYFLKFTSINILFLVQLVVFQISYSMYKKIQTSFIVSLLPVIFYLYTFRVITFLSSSIAVLILSLSIILFLFSREYIIFLGLFIPLIYFLNPFTCLYYLIPILVYHIWTLTVDKKKKTFLILIFRSSFFLLLLLMPYFVYITISGFNILQLINSYFRLMGFISLFNQNFNKIEFNNFFILETSIIKNIIDFFTTNFDLFNITFLLALFFGIFSVFGVISKKTDAKHRAMFLITKLSLVIIIISYTIGFIIEFNEIFSSLHDRIFETYCPLLIILWSIGYNNVFSKLRQIISLVKKKFSLPKKKKLAKCNRIKFHDDNIFAGCILILILLFHFSLYDLANEFLDYKYSDSTSSTYLFIMQNVPPNSKLLVPYSEGSKINNLLYEYVLFTPDFNINTSYTELNEFVEKNNLSYLILNKSLYNQTIFYRFNLRCDINLIFENSDYIIYDLLGVN